MSTSQQAAASRANGAQSQGPITAAGKARSSVNSRKHGLCSKELVLTDPVEVERFEQSVAELVFTYRAVTEVQKRACRHLAKVYWRRDVLDNLEMMFWQAVERGEVCAEAGGDGFPGLSSINRYRARIARDLKLARAEMDELFERRAKAFEAQMRKSKELTECTQLGGLIQELGQAAFQDFRAKVSNDPEQTNPKPPQTQATPGQASAQERKKQAKNKAQKEARRITSKNRK